MEAEDLLPPKIRARINRVLKENPTLSMIMDLPYKVRMYVVVQIPYPDVLRFCATSKKAKEVCDDDYFWKLKIERDFPDKAAAPEGRRRETYKKYWQEAQKKLLSCAKEGHIDCVESLLQLGISPDFKSKTGRNAGRTALLLASWDGHTDVIRLLLEHGANPDIQTDHGETAKIKAIEEGHADVVRLLESVSR